MDRRPSCRTYGALAMPTTEIREQHYQWIVVAVHRKTREVMVWCGVGGWRRITDGVPAQLVAAARVDELAREAKLTASDLVFDVVKLPVRDIVGRKQ